LSDELNDILGMIFERDPERRINIGDLKKRINNCRQFSVSQMATPPQSPLFAPEYDSPFSSISDDGTSSTMFDDGSLTGSASTLSDDSVHDSGSDSGYDSMESDSEDTFEVISKDESRPTAPYNRQQYVLPSQEYSYPAPLPAQKPVVHNPYVAPSPWLQAWFSNGYPYTQAQHVPQVFHPTPYAHYSSPFQHARGDCFYC
jgi:hypothetical protein